MIEIERAEPQIGAIITGVDVRQLSDVDFIEIYRTWLDRNVICLRGQSLEVEEFFAYSRRFGRLHEHPSKSTRHPEHPALTVLGIDKFNADDSPYFAFLAKKKLSKNKTIDAVGKTVLDQLVWTPPSLSLFYVTMAALEGRSAESTKPANGE